MGQLTRAEREARIERDDGAPDDEVYVVVTGARTRCTIYHADADCGRLNNDHDLETVPRATAQRRLRAPCIACVLEEYNPGPGSAPKLSQQLGASDFGPEDLGLSPVGERGDSA